ncbi:MAG: hypothetical protein NUW37_17490 [Planctomycetes bacterium]|nr:hypothetical protein [Planctomycetota bacterium]
MDRSITKETMPVIHVFDGKTHWITSTELKKWVELKKTEYRFNRRIGKIRNSDWIDGVVLSVGGVESLYDSRLQLTNSFKNALGLNNGLYFPWAFACYEQTAIAVDESNEERNVRITTNAGENWNTLEIPYEKFIIKNRSWAKKCVAWPIRGKCNVHVASATAWTLLWLPEYDTGFLDSRYKEEMPFHPGYSWIEYLIWNPRTYVIYTFDAGSEWGFFSINRYMCDVSTMDNDIHKLHFLSGDWNPETEHYLQVHDLQLNTWSRKRRICSTLEWELPNWWNRRVIYGWLCLSPLHCLVLFGARFPMGSIRLPMGSIDNQESYKNSIWLLESLDGGKNWNVHSRFDAQPSVDPFISCLEKI